IAAFKRNKILLIHIARRFAANYKKRQNDWSLWRFLLNRSFKNQIIRPPGGLLRCACQRRFFGGGEDLPASPPSRRQNPHRKTCCRIVLFLAGDPSRRQGANNGCRISD